MNWEKKRFRKMFPNIYRELEGDILPSVIDHIERCESVDEAHEVIEYFLKIGEISEEYAEFLKKSEIVKDLIGSRKHGEYTRRGLK
ncbi:DUF2095 family protein [Geoglobus acetivorans]|uniref:DUF2095 family protein n=1 Tax=Geoglobus acetivorans TaxID=565033 RepID=A0ABZ3H201_GEOAI|nr:DUF2095 family protein [Geoglobus acetivorans]